MSAADEAEFADSIEAHLAASYRRQVARIADALRRTADRLDNEVTDTSRVIHDAHNIEHELRWMYANLPIDTMFEMARELAEYQQRRPKP